ncbi:MAG: dihydroorotate dehydrogenase [Acidimicrobiia bacterium]|nr:dihydroorotate dehydrogenase [Acidimicrobiia bacterium]
MAPMRSIEVTLGDVTLRSPLIAASGTVGSVWEFAEVADLSAFGAAVAKSVSPVPWDGQPPPRMAPTRVGMLNAIGIQNPGIDEWLLGHSPRITALDVAVWGSTVATDPDGFAEVAAGLTAGGVSAIEINLSCPNLDGHLIATDPVLSGEVVKAVASVTDLPVSAKLAPDAERIVDVAGACIESGASWLVIANTVRGAAIDIDRRQPVLSGRVGGYSGPAVKPIAIRCIADVVAELGAVPIVGCGGITRGTDVIEYLMAGARAVQMGTALLADPRSGQRVLTEAARWCDQNDVDTFEEITNVVFW